MLDGPTGLVDTMYLRLGPSPPRPAQSSELSGAPVPAPQRVQATAPGSGYLTQQRAVALGMGTLATVGGIAAMAVLVSMSAPVTVPSALVASLTGIASAASLARGISKLVGAATANPEHLHEQVQETDEATKWAQPGNLIAKGLDSLLGTQGKIEERYEMYEAAKQLLEPFGKGTAEMIQKLSEKTEAMDAMAKAALKSQEEQQQQQQNSPEQGLGSENNFDSSH